MSVSPPSLPLPRVNIRWKQQKNQTMNPNEGPEVAEPKTQGRESTDRVSDGTRNWRAMTYVTKSPAQSAIAL